VNLWRKLVLFGAVAAAVSMVDVAAANADQYIDYGTNQAACQIAAQQSNATPHPGAASLCYETGPGHYTLLLSNS
jgi:hypothetical protein